MADTLSQLIPKVQAQLMDNGTLFNTTTCTAALRQALAEINEAVPQSVSISIPAVDCQKAYELTAVDASATGILDVLLEGQGDDAASLDFDAYVEESRWFFRLRAPRAAGETLLVHYTRPHTISGLDGAAESTLPDALNTALLNGGAYYCCLLRAANGVEANTVQRNVAGNWFAAAAIWEDIFHNSLRDAKRQPVPVGEPDTRAWNDEWHHS